MKILFIQHWQKFVRHAIARALVDRPKLFLADEPTAALDSQTGKDVIRLLQQLASHCYLNCHLR